MASGHTNYEKFKLLMWKNYKLQLANKCQLILIVLLMIVGPLYMLLGNVRKPKPYQVPAEMSDPASIPLPPFDNLLYSPKNKILEAIVEEAAANLNTKQFKSCTNAKKLNEELIATLTNNNDTLSNGVPQPIKLPIIAGVEFNDAWSDISKLPQKFVFALRFFPGSNMIEGGFIGLQSELCKAYLKQKNASLILPKITIEPFPHPAYSKDEFVDGLSALGFLPYILFLAYLYPCMCISQYLVEEKENQLKEIMLIMGLSNGLLWLSWYVKSFLLLGICSIIIVFMWTVLPSFPLYITVFIHLSPTILALFLLIYSHACICLAFMISSFCSRSTRTGIVTIIVFFGTAVPFIYVADTDYYSLSTMILLSLPTNSAVAFICTRLLRREQQGIGLQWNNLFKNTWPGDNISVGLLLIMMLIASLICLLICLYVEQFQSGAYTWKSWYFPCTKRYWYPRRIAVDRQPDNMIWHRWGFWNPFRMSFGEDAETMTNPRGHHLKHEAGPEGKKVGVQLHRLSKSFGQRKVVKSVSFKMYEGEITVLLGHNGAGKTTTISMLAGLIKPTHGTAYINGHDIRTELVLARSTMSICPQHDILYDELSVATHIQFFCRLKGLRGADIEQEVRKYLIKLNLEGKAKTKAKKLSGGMKRRLSLACALCGNTKTVFCDEPTSGLDPASRREVWDLMMSEKQGRTILLTTHFMDEAEVLGDRIAIMGDGRLLCYGTTFHLKQQHDAAYILSCEKAANCKVNKLTRLLGNYVPGIRPHTNFGSELTYRLPQQYTESFKDMLSALEEQQKELGVSGFGVSAPSLSEIFMKVGGEAQLNKNKNQLEDEKLMEMELSEEAEELSEELGWHDEENEEEWLSEEEHSSQFTETSSKYAKDKNKGRCAHCMSQWHAMLLKKSLYIYRHKIIFIIAILAPIIYAILAKIIEPSNKEEIDTERTPINFDPYKTVVIVLENSASGEPGKRIAKSFGKLAQAVGHFYTTDGKKFSDYIIELGKTKQEEIKTNYLTGATIGNDAINAWYNAYYSKFSSDTPALAINFVYNAIANAMIGPSAIIKVTKRPIITLERIERENMMEVLVTILVVEFYMSIVVVLFLPFIIIERAKQLKMQQIVAGVSAWTFWLSHLIFDFLIYVLIVVVLLLVLHGFAPTGKLAYVLLIFGLAMLPTLYLVSFLFNRPATGMTVVIMFNLLIVMSAMLVGFDQTGLVRVCLCIYPLFSFCGAFRNAVQKSDGYFRTYVICLIVSAIVFCIILCFLEYRICRCSALKRQKKNKSSDKDNDEDEDVVLERKRVTGMSKEELKVYPLVIDRVSKRYCRKKAVSDVTLCVEPGVCCGLLGSNGAGKTSTFKMIVGESTLSAGNIYIKGFSIVTKCRRAQKQLGYCPQFDTLFDFLTGRETLKIFLLLHDVPRDRINEIAEKLSEDFGFRKHLDKQSKHYSGGTKRKLNAALASSGRSLICLDEPTTGIDPVSKRHLWVKLAQLRDEGKSLLLTSHSMEECEALCSRLAIMAAGKFRCLGSQIRIKTRFGKAITLKMQVNSPIDSMKDVMDTIENQLQNDYPESKLTEKYEFRGLLTFSIPNKDLKWSEIFGYIEDNRESWHLADYSLTQTSLEDIFLEFAKK